MIDKTKLTPPRLIRVQHQIPGKYCTPVMFTRFVCALLSFCVRKFPSKSEIQETRKLIVKCTSYVIDTIPNSLDGHQLLTQYNRNLWIIYINREYPTTYQVSLNEIHHHQAQCGESKIISVYVEGRATRGQILNIFGTYLIMSDLWFHILKFFSQRNLQTSIILAKVLKFLGDNHGKNIYLWNITRTKASYLFRLPYQ